MFGLDWIFALGFIGIIAGASVVAVSQANASQRKDWLEEMEARRREDRYSRKS